MRDLILQLTKISIYSTKPSITGNQSWRACTTSECVGWGYASPRTCCTRWTCPDTRQFRGTVSACWMRQVCLQRSELITCEGTVIYCPPPIQSMGLPHQILLSTQSRKSYFFLRRCLGHCCKVSDEAAFCLIQRPYISKTLLTRRISPRGSP